MAGVVDSTVTNNMFSKVNPLDAVAAAKGFYTFKDVVEASQRWRWRPSEWSLNCLTCSNTFLMMYRHRMLRTSVAVPWPRQGPPKHMGKKAKTRAQQKMMSVAMPNKGVNVHSVNWSFDMLVLAQSAECGLCHESQAGHKPQVISILISSITWDSDIFARSTEVPFSL